MTAEREEWKQKANQTQDALQALVTRLMQQQTAAAPQAAQNGTGAPKRADYADWEQYNAAVARHEAIQAVRGELQQLGRVAQQQTEQQTVQQQMDELDPSSIKLRPRVGSGSRIGMTSSRHRMHPFRRRWSSPSRSAMIRRMSCITWARIRKCMHVSRSCGCLLHGSSWRLGKFWLQIQHRKLSFPKHPRQPNRLAAHGRALARWSTTRISLQRSTRLGSPGNLGASNG